MNGGSSMEEAGGQVGLLAVVGSVCWGRRALGRGCVQCKRIRISTAGGIQVGGMSTQLNRYRPSAAGCRAGLPVGPGGGSQGITPSWGLFPSHCHGACSRNDGARAVSQSGNALQLS